MPRKYQGKYLIAKNVGTAKVFMPPPSPNPAGLKDEVLPAGEEVSIPREWAGSERLDRLISAGTVVIRWSDTLPPDSGHRLAPEYEEALDPSQKQFVMVLAQQPLTPQLKDAIHLGNLVTDAGVPRPRTKVTVGYLKETHSVILKAAKDLETRWLNRPDNLKEYDQALQRIESL